MQNRSRGSGKLGRKSVIALLAGIVVAFIMAQTAQAQSFTILYAFTGGEDGALPAAPLFIDEAGNIYGTTANGGNFSACEAGCGVVFKLDPRGRETVLYPFGGGDGASPRGKLIRDAAGDFYGTTYFGGTGYNNCSEGCGVVFELTPTGTETVLHVFGSFPGDGEQPIGGLLSDTSGNLYGTTVFGGPEGANGTVFALNSSGVETILHNFNPYEGKDGANPYGSLTFDQNGNLFGTTYGGGATRLYGTVFEVTPTGKEKVIYNFMGGSDGCAPSSDLVVDEAGNLYGTTYNNGGSCGGYGTVFQLTLDGEDTVLHSFSGGSDGAFPFSGVIRDSQGNLYGTTPYGGIATGFSGYGVVYKIDPSGVETVLHTFRDGIDGASPNGLTMDATGNLYGTTNFGGPYDSGVVFKIVP
jgi:uncharacterized repeat protein (TIGR03803 family)